MNKKRIFNQILKNIKTVKIQGARNIAKKALYAYSLFPSSSTKKKLLALRPTEPMLVNVLHRLNTQKQEEIYSHFDVSQDQINKEVFQLIKNNDLIYTHCHSTNVVQALIYAKKKGKRFAVCNTETRPLFQGRKTAQELKKTGISVTMFVDSAFDTIISGDKKVNKIFLGADALLKKGIINKIGSRTIAKLAKSSKVPVYVIADSWKYSPKRIKIEERDFHEIWNKIPKSSHIKIKNPAFEFVSKKYIHRIISELGNLKYKEFLRKAKKN
jgi:ribose 1,5-bisphosphate isomerase